MRMLKKVSIRPALAAERPLLEQLAQFYIYDFSELEPADSDRFEFDETGSLGTLSDLGDYWSQASFHPLLLRVGVGGSPSRSTVARRMRVRLSASGENASPSGIDTCSSASIGVRTRESVG